MTDVDAGSLYGTLNLLILRTLADGDALHGLEIQRSIGRATGDALSVEVGALYPALHRLEAEGLLESEWGISDRRRRAKFYQITSAGQKRLARERRQWESLTRAVGRVLGTASEGAG